MYCSFQWNEQLSFSFSSWRFQFTSKATKCFIIMYLFYTTLLTYLPSKCCHNYTTLFSKLEATWGFTYIATYIYFKLFQCKICPGRSETGKFFFSLLRKSFITVKKLLFSLKIAFWRVPYYIPAAFFLPNYCTTTPFFCGQNVHRK